MIAYLNVLNHDRVTTGMIFLPANELPPPPSSPQDLSKSKVEASAEHLQRATSKSRIDLLDSRRVTIAGNPQVSPFTKTSLTNSLRKPSQSQCNISPSIASETTSSKMVNMSIMGPDARSLKNSSPGGMAQSSLLPASKSASMKTVKRTLGSVVQTQQSTSNPRLAAQAGVQQSYISQTTSPNAVTISGTSPTTQKGINASTRNSSPAVNITHPKLAPSCLKKVIPNLSSYPTIDAADLEYVMDPNGTKVVLGSGSIADVLLMRRHSDGTVLAVKRLKTNCFRIKIDKDMLEEVIALRAVRHCPFFPKLLGIIDHSSFALEVIGDGSKDSAKDFERARFNFLDLLTCREWLHVCRDVTAGLMALHHAGFLHNDLHSGNVMVCRNPPGSEVAWTGKIIDLGCAQRVNNLALPLILTKEEKQELYRDATQVTDCK